MKDDEFNKLDAFMQANAPLEKSGGKSIAGPSSSPFKMALPFALTLGLAGFFSWNLMEKRHFNQSYEAMAEVMLWDVTTDEMPVELEEKLDFLD